MVPTPDRIARIYVSFRDAFSSSPSSSSSSASRALVLRLAHRRRARANVSLYAYLLVHTAVCIKGRGLHIAFMMQRRPALAGNNASTTASTPRAVPTVPLLPSSHGPLLLPCPPLSLPPPPTPSLSTPRPACGSSFSLVTGLLK